MKPRKRITIHEAIILIQLKKITNEQRNVPAVNRQLIRKSNMAAVGIRPIQQDLENAG